MRSFIFKHTIVSIGTPVDQKDAFVEVIVDNPKELILIVEKSAYYISEIRFYHRVKIMDGSMIGYGGPTDPRDSSYYFAETDYDHEFSLDAEINDYLKYVHEIESLYPEYQMIPSFTLSYRNLK